MDEGGTEKAVGVCAHIRLHPHAGSLHRHGAADHRGPPDVHEVAAAEHGASRPVRSATHDDVVAISGVASGRG